MLLTPGDGLKAEVVVEKYGMERDADGIKCSCGGYADKVETTHEENMKYDCGRYQMSYAMSGKKVRWSCCAAAFKCAVCGTRIVGRQAAPDMD
jgi:hypothetical protein